MRFAAVGDPISGPEVVDSLPYGQHDSAAGISAGRPFVEPLTDLIDCLSDPDLAYAAPDFGRKLGIVRNLRSNAASTVIDSLRSGADHGMGDPNQDVSRRHERSRDIVDMDASSPIKEDLFHDDLTLSRCHEGKPSLLASEPGQEGRVVPSTEVPI